MIYPPPSSRRSERALPPRARLAWRSVAGWGLLILVLGMVMSVATLPRRGGSDHQAANTFVEPAVTQHDLSEDDPPLESKHQASPAKKPRLKTLLVQTTPAADPMQRLAFHLCSCDAAPMPHHVARHTAPEPRSRRRDPVLRLHPGQAPPRLVA